MRYTDKEYIRKQKNYIRSLQRELKAAHESNDVYWEKLRVEEEKVVKIEESHKRFLNEIRSFFTWIHWRFTSEKYKV